MIAGVVQTVLGGLGAILAWIYELIPNYGVTIVLFTILVRLVLLPLGIKQIRSMHEMQTIQPKVKAIQQKYKGNRTKVNEEIMKLYQERGVNPLSGCWPLLLQLPILFALFAVLRPPVVGANGELTNVHFPESSGLRVVVIDQQDAPFLGSNLLCNALEAGKEVPLKDPEGNPAAGHPARDCGDGIPARIPYYAFALLMIGTTFYQQHQMQKAAPPGQNPQMQAVTKVMPLIFGFWGFIFPAALVVYWTTSNIWQIGQQHFMIKARQALDEQDAGKKPRPRKRKKGWLASMMERAEGERQLRAGDGAESSEGSSSKGQPAKGSSKGSSKGKSPGQKPGTSSKKPGSGGGSARDRKKRRKR